RLKFYSDWLAGPLTIYLMARVAFLGDLRLSVFRDEVVLRSRQRRAAVSRWAGMAPEECNDACRFFFLGQGPSSRRPPVHRSLPPRYRDSDCRGHARRG